MPQAVRRESAQTAQTMQDKELKRARGAISCAECRRLKLKCDKTVPCSSCKRRGCSAICPNGSLKTGQGTRFVLADTEKLHHKIAQMSDRIRQLEDALALLQSTMTNEPHPLLSRDLMKIKSSIDLHSAVDEQESDQPASAPEPDESPLDQFGTLAIRDDGGATFYGRSAGSESLLVRETADSPESTPPLPSAQVLGQSYDNPSLVDHMSNMFPFQPTYASVSFAQLRSCLPHWERASALFALYFEVGPWFFGVVTKGQVEDEIIPLWYPESDASNNASTSSHFPSTPVSPGPGALNPKENPHELAVAFMVLCFGALTDLDLPPAPDNQDAEQYYSLSKAAIGLEPLLDRSPSIATVQTLAMMGIYEGLRNKDNGIEATWMLMGMACKMAQSIGLHRDSARFKLPPAEVQKRRALFWELFITDCWQSLATGRLATFSLPFVDCELPGDPDQTMAEDGTPQPSFPYWKARFGAECVAAVSQGVLTARAPRYSIILDLDRKVRNMELPKYAQGDPPTGVGLGKTMLHFMPINYKELTLQYIHRCFFAHALTTSADPMKSEYAPSFTAGYLSAKTMISSVKQQFLLFPKQICRFWVLWTHAFSSSVMLSSVVTHSPKTKVAHAALLELRGALELFESAASHGGRAQKFLPIIRRLHTQSQHVFLETNSGVPPRIHNDIFRPSNQEDDRDDLLVFSGKTTTVTTKARSNAGSQSGGSQRSSMSPGHPEATSPSGTDFASNPVFADVHPVLISELDRFDGAITAQLQDFYAVGDARRGSQVDFGRMAQQRLRVQVPGAGERQAFGERMSPTYGGQSQMSMQASGSQPYPRRPSDAQDGGRRPSMSQRRVSVDMQQQPKQQAHTPELFGSPHSSHHQPSPMASGSAFPQYPPATTQFTQYTFPQSHSSASNPSPAQTMADHSYGQPQPDQGPFSGNQGQAHDQAADAHYQAEQQRRQQLEQQQRQQQEEAYRQSLAQQQHSHHPEQLAYPPDQDQYAYTQRPPQAQQSLPQQQHRMQVVSQHAHVAQQHDHGGAYTSGSTSYQTFAGAYQPGAASYDPLPADVPRATAMTYGSSFAPLTNGVAAPPYTQDGQRLAHHGHPYVNGRELPPNGHAVHGYPPGHAPPTYTPDFAMHGTAANDPRLQETWDYMTMSPDYHHHG